MDARIGLFFDNRESLEFVQGEDRTIVLKFFDRNTKNPIDISSTVVSLNMPLAGGGSVKRTSSGPVVESTQVVIPSGSVPNGYVNLPDHGLVTDDPITVAPIGSGVLPAPLAAATQYLVQVIDVNNFYVTDLEGNIISLTSQGSGAFTLTNANDLQVSAGPLGQATLKLRAAVSAVVNPGRAQDFQAGYNISGAQRWEVIRSLLDVEFQPAP